ncbi:MAG: fumarylacetoacetate hydrolase family protein [Polyangiaceae bacterium]
MKLVTYRQGRDSGRDSKGLSASIPGARAGILVGTDVVDLRAGLEAMGAKADPEVLRAGTSSVLGFVENASILRPLADELARKAAEKTLPAKAGEVPVVLPLADVTLFAPIPRPPSMRDGYAFRQHVETARRNRGLEMIPEFDMFPVFYFTNHGSVIGPGPLRVQKETANRLDFELEAAIVVGREGRNLTKENADAHVFGMTIMNDFSARALQMEEMKLSLGPAKGKDFATGLGPWLVTMDELASHMRPSPEGARFDMEMRAFVNGKQVSLGNVKDMNWTFAQILERVSYGVTVSPGDVIGSGTCGTGCFLELNGSKITDNQWLRHGDTVALEIDGLGRLENTVEVDTTS